MKPFAPTPPPTPIAQLIAGLPALGDVTRELHRRSFYAFFIYMWPELEPTAPYIKAIHTRVVCEHLQAVHDGLIPKLAIEIGPGYGKSFISAVAFPAWIWACRDVGYRMGFSTYADDLTTRDSGRFLRLIQSELYQTLYGHRFKLVKAREDWQTNDQGGYRVALSVKGQVTGHRFNLWIGDDLLNLADARSDVKREPFKVHLSAVSTRGQIGKPYYRVIIGQRLHEDDPGNYAREKGFEVLCLPTEYDPSRSCQTHDVHGRLFFSDWRTTRGELLFPDGFGPERVAQAKEDLGPYDYSAQHQHLPVPVGGGVLKAEYVQLFKPSARPKAAFYFLSIDTAQGTDAKNDTTAITVWGVFSEGIFLADGWTGRAPANEVLDMLTGNTERGIVGFGRQYSPSLTVVEAKDWGKALMSLLEANRRWHWKLEPYVPLVSKDVRAHEAQPFFFRRRIWMEEGHPLTQDALAQLSVFPKSKIRDLADCIVQAAIHANKAYTFEKLGLDLSYEGGKRTSATRGSIYDISTDDDDDF
jgi:hypothetical protein